MINGSQDYSLFIKFIEIYGPTGFKGIRPDNPLMTELEKMMEINDQFFYVADIIQIQVLFTSKRSTQMLGVEPDVVSPYHFMEATHPDDIQRLNLGRAKLIKMAQDLFIAEKGSAVLSTNLKVRNSLGGYTDFLIQCYLFYTLIPYKTVFLVKIHTNIDWHKKIKNGYHYYVGNDLGYFRYPDEKMLMKGNIFTDREFEVIRLVGSGLSSEQIAKQLFLSVHTINTHRRNILVRSGKKTMAELIYELMERGVL
jgi:DNA-binding CsgD family transcriptional regulator